MEILKSFWNGFKAVAGYCAVVYSILAMAFGVFGGLFEVVVDHTNWLDKWI